MQDLLLSGSSIYRAIGDESNGQIAFYRNVGSASNPAFTLISDDWLGLSLLITSGIDPCFGDIVNDGLDDMLGNSEGRLIHCLNAMQWGVLCLIRHFIAGLTLEIHHILPCMTQMMMVILI